MHNNNDSFGTIGRVGRVGGYEIVDTIARGGMAVVFRARQPALNRIAALKRLDLRSDDRTVVARFVRESKLGAAFEHPNIVSVFDFFEHDGVPYIAMEYLARGSLRPWVGKLAELQVIGVLEGVLAGLAHAQEHNLAHRDLKPENVLLTRRGGIKIADFGIAKAYTNATQRLTATGMAVGTPTYMAPEQATAGEVGPGTDLYALGVMAYELFSGRPPFADDGNAMALLYRHVHEPAPPLTQVDPRLSAWVARLLEKDPAKRPASALDAWESLEDLAVEKYGPLWRREAAIGGSTRQLDSLPADVPVPVRDTPAPETSGGSTSAPKLLPDTPVGEPAAAVGGPFLIVGPDATIEVSDGGHGAALRHVTRWRRPRTRSRRQRLHPLPLRFPNHVDRVSEIASLGDSVTGAHAVNVYGDRAIGKTHVLVEALQGSKRTRGDAVFLDGRGQSADDLLHTLFEEFYVTRTAVRDPRIARHLRTCSATVAIEHTSLGNDELKHLLDGAPRCRFILTSRERVLWDGSAIKVGGMAPEFAPALAAQELGQELVDDDHDAAIAIGASLSGHPLRLRQAFSQARESGAPLAALREELAAPPVLQDRLASLSELEARVVRSLAPYGGVSVAGEHLRAVVSEPELDAALDHLEQRHDVARENGRYRLLGVLAHALPLSDDLSEETGRATAHFTSWLQGQAVDSDAALEDMPAILALVERSFLEGHSVEAIRLGRAAEGYLSSRQRWAAWGLVLAIVLACAKDLDDGFTEGWAWNQLGVRSLGLGRTTEAQRLLEKALDVRELAGDEQGAAVTRGNLHTLQHVPAPLPRLSHGSPLPVVGMVVIVIAALVGRSNVHAVPDPDVHADGDPVPDDARGDRGGGRAMRTCPNPKCGREWPAERDWCTCGEYLRWEATGTTPGLVDLPVAAPNGTPLMTRAVPPAVVPIALLAEDGEWISSPTLEVQPGERASLRVRIRNQRGIIDRFSVVVDGLRDGWWSVTPHTLHLMPFGSNGASEQDAIVTLHPPRIPEATAGDWPIRLLVLAGDERREVARASATVRIGRFDALEVTLTPQRRARRRRARYRVKLSNGGNAAAVVGLAASDDGERCRLRLEHERIELAPRIKVESMLRVRPRRPLLIGAPIEHRLGLAVSAPGEPVVPPSVVYAQRAWIPRWLPLAVPPVALLVAGALTLPARVPDVRGVAVDEAKRELDAHHLEWQAPELRQSRQPVGTVLETIPPAGAVRLRGARVTLIVATDSRRARVPGLEAKTTRAIDSEPAGTVLSTKPARGALAPGSTVALRVSAGFPQLAYDDGRRIHLADGRDGTSRRRLKLAGGGRQSQPAWTPDGQRLVSRSGGEDAGRIWVASASPVPRGGRALTSAGQDDRRPAVSPDGNDLRG